MAERERNGKGQFVSTHGGRKTHLYSIWCAMKRRCNCPSDKRYKRYGGRGIKVCEEWKDFANFRDWSVAHGYKPELTIDRVDNNGNYCPDNCRWVTRAVQNRNYSRNHLITYQGKTMCIADWEEETGINRGTILWRISHGKPLEEVFDKKDNRFKER